MGKLGVGRKMTGWCEFLIAHFLSFHLPKPPTCEWEGDKDIRIALNNTHTHTHTKRILMNIFSRRGSERANCRNSLMTSIILATSSTISVENLDRMWHLKPLILLYLQILQDIWRVYACLLLFQEKINNIANCRITYWFHLPPNKRKALCVKANMSC